MKARVGYMAKSIAALSYTLGVVSLMAGILMTMVYGSARAADTGRGNSTGSDLLQEEEACTPPSDFDRTVRLHHAYTTTKEWQFEIPEDEMDVVLQFFYYQDYSSEGCPFDCSTGECQLDEIGEGDTPFGPFSIEDGKEGPDGGSVRLDGRLSKGTYTASFQVTGQGSINIGLNVRRESVPTATPEPPPTATPTPTEIPPSPTPTDIVVPPVPPTADETPMATETPTAPTATNTPTSETPDVTETPTGDVPPPTTEETPMATPTDIVLPPDEPQQPPATLPPPSVPTDQPPQLIPATGGETLLISGPGVQSVLPQSLYLKLGIGLLGLALMMHGLGSRLK